MNARQACAIEVLDSSIMLPSNMPLLYARICRRDSIQYPLYLSLGYRLLRGANIYNSQVTIATPYDV